MCRSVSRLRSPKPTRNRLDLVVILMAFRIFRRLNLVLGLKALCRRLRIPLLCLRRLNVYWPRWFGLMNIVLCRMSRKLTNVFRVKAMVKFVRKYRLRPCVRYPLKLR